MQTSRRAILGALAVAPVLISAPAIAANPASDWDAAMLNWQKAKAAAERCDPEIHRLMRQQDKLFGGHVFPDDPRYPECKEWRETSGYDRICDESETLTDIQCEWERKLITMPAPHHAAVVWKLEKLFGHEARDPDDYTASWSPDYVAQFLDDVRNMGGRP